MPASSTILVTHALPYANGALHIGHLLGYIQSDIWVRARRMAGDTVHFVAADDVHGTPIMLAAEKAGMAPEEFIKGMQISHEADFRDFGVAHDYYYTTHSPENQELAELVYRRLRDARPHSHITTRAVRQFYDPLKQMFLPDRYIKGECPNCGTPDQYGDNCENCGATYAPTDLKNPRSVVSGATPELRDSEHYFFKLGDFTAFLRDWLGGKVTGDAVAHPSIAAKLKEWLDADGGLRDWDISRDAPYFGFPIPDAPGKFFYVWLDAPIGYLAAFKKYCSSEKGKADGLTPAYFDEFMSADVSGALSAQPSALAREMHHFLGKDIINFHGLFWPAMLQGAGLRTPNKLYVNGYLTVNGEKMSKSRGTFIQARTYLDAGLNPEYLRYYFATMLDPGPSDIDLNLSTFIDVVNSHLVGKYINIASRAGKILSDHFGGRIADLTRQYDGVDPIETFQQISIEDKRMIPLHYKSCRYGAAVSSVVALADKVNEFLQKQAPWKRVKSGSDAEMFAAQLACSAAIEAFRVLTIFLRPILPDLAIRAAKFLSLDANQLTWDAAEVPLPEGHLIGRYEHLLTRVDAKQVETMIEASKESMVTVNPSPPNPPLEGEGSRAGAASAPPSPQPSPASGRGGKSEASAAVPARAAASASPQPSPLSPALISIDDFSKLDLRIGTVLQCEFVDGSDKLLRFELDAGELGKRQIFSGMRAAYQEPAKLVGRKVVFIANLAPRKMRFGISEGMVLSAGSGGDQLFLLDVDDGAKSGMPVK